MWLVCDFLLFPDPDQDPDLILDDNKFFKVAVCWFMVADFSLS